MRSIKAIIAGSLFIVVVILLTQLAYIFIAVGYNSLGHHYLFLMISAVILDILLAFLLLW
jgi:hypothetical protein